MLRLLSTSSASLITFSPLLFKASSSALMVAASLKLASALASSSSKPASVFATLASVSILDLAEPNDRLGFLAQQTAPERSANREQGTL
uniref:Putative secreted protein n=1 Tax=Anopheles darlingi TaxID=43151 RepID=A0A2M4DNF2_ANODA